MQPRQPAEPEASPRHDLPSVQSHDYGSNASNEAVKKLESLGASVYPPESKQDMDWGVLAGGLSLLLSVHLSYAQSSPAL